MSRPQGIVETTPRAEKPPMPRHTKAPLSESDIKKKWLIFESRVYCIGTMYASDYKKMVKSYATTDEQVRLLLRNIGAWDDTARWYTALYLVKWRKITLYDSREQAEQAMRRAG